MGAYDLSVENRQEDREKVDGYVEKKIVLISTEMVATTLDLFVSLYSSPVYFKRKNYFLGCFSVQPSLKLMFPKK